MSNLWAKLFKVDWFRSGNASKVKTETEKITLSKTNKTQLIKHHPPPPKKKIQPNNQTKNQKESPNHSVVGIVAAKLIFPSGQKKLSNHMYTLGMVSGLSHRMDHNVEAQL